MTQMFVTQNLLLRYLLIKKKKVLESEVHRLNLTWVTLPLCEKIITTVPLEFCAFSLALSGKDTQGSLVELITSTELSQLPDNLIWLGSCK